MKTGDGGPAFPDKLKFSPFGNCSNSDAVLSGGMSLRDWFAGQALANSTIADSGDAQQDVQWCYRWADAMLAERAK